MFAQKELSGVREVINDPIQKRSIVYDALTQDKLELIIFPTEKYNFRCTYCYEDFEKGRMSRDTIDGIKNLISTRGPTLHHLHLSWFGGEPLIAYDIVREIMYHGHDLAKEHNFKLQGSVTTNGYTLSRERMIELARLGVEKIQITLDGDQGGHDKTRLRIDGSGSFDQIWDRLLELNELVVAGDIANCRVILRIHIHPQNIESVRSLVARISSELDHRAFSIHFKAVGHWGGSNDKVFDVFDEGVSSFKDLQKSLYGSLGEFKPEFNDDAYVCYAAKANSLTIRSDGTIGKCTVLLNSEINNIGQLTAGGELNLDLEKFNAWLHALSTFDVLDLECPVARIPNVQRVTESV